MNAYEEMINIMKEQGSKTSTQGIRIGTMKSATTCMLGELELEKDDLIVSEHIKAELQKGDMVAICRLNEETYIILERLVRL